MGGLNGIFKFNGEIGPHGIMDFNNASETGFYKVALSSGSIAHRPPGTDYGILIVIISEGYRLQLLFDLFNSNAFFRAGDNTFNETWHKFNQ